MITIKNYNFDYYRYIFITSGIILFGILLKVFDKRPYVLLETILLTFGLLFSLIYLSDNRKVLINTSKIFILFLLYLFVFNLSMVFLRPFEVDITFFDSLFFAIQEFRLSTLGYFLPLIFIPIAIYEQDRVITIFITLSKIAIAYTIFEQVISMAGFRAFFESLYFNSGVVTSNQIGVKSFGIYRIWGLIGSPQILGVFHIMTLALMLHSKNNLWAFMSGLCVFLSTSKTAILILILLLFLYLLVNRKYLLLILTGMLIFFIGFTLYSISERMVSIASSDYPHIQKFVQSIQGYFYIMINEIDLNHNTSTRLIHETGPLSLLSRYFTSNPLELFFGKGITYSFLTTGTLSQSVFAEPDTRINELFYLGLSSDFYILTFFEQYGIFGTLFLSVIYLAYPMILLFKRHSYILYIPITFFLATFHYPPQISKIIMLFLAFSIWMIYLKAGKSSEKITTKQVPLH
jgi:hypothetical protein